MSKSLNQMTSSRRGWLIFGRYAATRLLTAACTVVVAVYLTILVANLGGYVDEIIRARVAGQIMGMVQGGYLSDVPPEEREPILDELAAQMESAEGLDSPFALRTIWWLQDGLTFNWGNALPSSFTDPGQTPVVDLIATHLSHTLLVFGLSNVLLLITSVVLALLMMRMRNGVVERIMVILSPLSGAPAWVYGIVLTVILVNFGQYSFNSAFDTSGAEFSWAYTSSLLRALALPLIAIFISGLLQSVFAWRAFFMVYGNEPYVELGRAKGLSHGAVERGYILRPALPALLTSLALLIMSLWQEVIALEYFFNVEGIGKLLIDAIRRFDTGLIVALVVTFAYLLAITVFLLDIAYALVDPRIRLVDGGSKERLVTGWRPTLRIGLPSLRAIVSELRMSGARLANGLRQFARSLGAFPSAIAGLVVIAALIIVSLVTVVALPYDETIAQWRGENGAFTRNPRSAAPAWTNLFRRDKLPESIQLYSSDAGVRTSVTALNEDTNDFVFEFPFVFDADRFPQDLVVDVSAEFVEKAPYVVITLDTPDDRSIELTSFGSKQQEAYFASVDDRLQRRLDSEYPQEALFMGMDSAEKPLKGTYTLKVSALTFESDSTVDVKMTLIGQLFGLAGTDEARRDLTIPLLWGTPVALAFGLGAAVATSIFALLISALGAWYGGWVDRIVQFLTDVNLILPFFPVALMVFTLYSKSIWAILGVTVLLSLFGDAIKVYRATFLQLRESAYVQAAQAYGATDWRIATRYLVPQMTGVLLPKLMLLVPGFVFLEATLAFLGVSDPELPTWGKLIVAALDSTIYGGLSHIVILPLAVLFLTSLAFALVAQALEKIYQPNLYQ